MGRTLFVLIAAVALVLGLCTLKNEIAFVAASVIAAATVVYFGVVFLMGSRPKAEPFFFSAKWTPRGRRIIATLGSAAVLNFIAFLVGFAYLGGAASGGGEVNGHYYVFAKGRAGGHTEVTRGEFTYSRVHELSIFVTGGIYMLAWPFVLLTGDYRPKP